MDKFNVYNAKKQKKRQFVVAMIGEIPVYFRECENEGTALQCRL